MVILVHTAQLVPGISVFLDYPTKYGQMGVQLFFMASAYTLCLSWDARDSEKRRYLNYGIRRFFRIAPLYYFGIALYLGLAVIANKYKSGTWEIPEQYSIHNIVANILFVHGFFPPIDNVVPGGWSIGIEMIFYTIFPVVFLIFREASQKSWKRVLILFFSVIFTSQLIQALVGYFLGDWIQNNNSIYFSLINQIPVFLIGICFYLINKEFNFRFSLKRCFVSSAAFMLLTLFSLFLWELRISWLFTYIPIISGISFIFLWKIFENNQYLDYPLLRKFGTLSYSMYIFHFLFLNKFIKYMSPRMINVLGADATLLLCYLLCILMTYVVSIYSARYIESYFAQLGKKLIKILNTK